MWGGEARQEMRKLAETTKIPIGCKFPFYSKIVSTSPTKPHDSKQGTRRIALNRCRIGGLQQPQSIPWGKLDYLQHPAEAFVAQLALLEVDGEGLI